MTRLRTRANCGRAADHDTRVNARIERECRAHVETMTPERRAQLEGEWK